MVEGRAHQAAIPEVGVVHPRRAPVPLRRAGLAEKNAEKVRPPAPRHGAKRPRRRHDIPEVRIAHVRQSRGNVSSATCAAIRTAPPAKSPPSPVSVIAVSA